MLNGFSSERRNNFYNKYKSSDIFNTNNQNSQRQISKNYLKYKKSELFDNEYSKQEKIPEITNKVNEKNYNKQFEPQYSKLTAFERYQKQMGNDPEIYKKNLDLNYTEIIRKNKTNKELNNEEEEKENYNAYNKYIKDFYGKKYLNEYNIKNNIKHKRSKTLFQKRSYTTKNIDNNNNNNVLINKYRNIEFNKSNIFNLNEDENYKDFSYKKPDSFYIEHVPEKRENLIKRSKTMRQLLTPSNTDWKYFNTELSEKEHINKIKNNNTNEQIKFNKPPNFTKETSTKEITEYYYDKFVPQNYDNDKDVQNFEIKGNKEIFQTTLEPLIIKKIFLKNGLQIYDMNEKCVNYKSQVNFKIRKDKNEPNFNNKINKINLEIMELGGKMNKIDINEKTYHKKRNKTPGKALKKENNVNTKGIKNNFGNTKLQYNIGYKNSYKKTFK